MVGGFRFVDVKVKNVTKSISEAIIRISLQVTDEVDQL
jgi:hypothetical protein